MNKEEMMLLGGIIMVKEIIERLDRLNGKEDWVVNREELTKEVGYLIREYLGDKSV